jgi:hypothetical protein
MNSVVTSPNIQNEDGTMEYRLRNLPYYKQTCDRTAWRRGNAVGGTQFEPQIHIAEVFSVFGTIFRQATKASS